MRMDVRKCVLAAVLLVTWSIAGPNDALASGYDDAATGRADVAMESSVRAQSQGWIVPPEPTLVVGGGLTVLTSAEDLEPLLGVDNLTQTDVVMLGLATRYSWGQRVELYGSGTFLPKKPSVVDASIWQEASLGALISLSKRDLDDHEMRQRMRERELPPPKFALWVNATGGTLVDSLGYWNSAIVGARYQQAIDRYVVLKAMTGVNGTALWLDDYGSSPPRFAEAMVGGEIVLGDGRAGAFWINTQFFFPFYASAGGSNDDIGSEYALDPTTRANIHLGGALSFVDNWDIYLKLSLLDRGELEQLETTLPILPGGFDQTTITLGLNYRWTFDEDERP